MWQKAILVLFACGFGVLQAQTCPSLVAVVQDNEKCQMSDTTCSGLQCLFNSSGLNISATLTVFKCLDPIVVQLTVEANTRLQRFVQNFTKSGTMQFDSNPSVTFAVSLEANLTADTVTFSVMLQYENGNPPSIVIPQASVPLDSSSCTCASVTALALILNTGLLPIEQNCSANRECDGVRCTLVVDNVFGSAVFYLEVVALPCVQPTALELIVENSAFVRIGQWVLVESGNSTGSVAGLSFDVMSVVRRGSRSISAETYMLYDPSVGPIEVLPDFPIILDFSDCREVPQEWCQSIIDATNWYPECESLGNCSGVQCSVRDSTTISGQVTAFVVNKCAETLSVQVYFTSDVTRSTESLVFSGLGLQTGTLQTGQQVNASLELDAMADELKFKAYAEEGDILVPFVPSIAVPLNSSECMCNDLVDLAEKINSETNMPDIENNCTANSECDGVRCELSVSGFVLFVEVIVLPCTHPPSGEMFIEDAMQRPLAEVIFNQSGPVTFFVLGFRFDVKVVLETDGRVMRVAASLTDPIMLNIFPLHSIILDRSSCSTGPVMEEQCQSLQLSALINPECDPLGNCTGMSCEVRDIIVNGKAAFTVQKCQDPLSVQVSFVPDDGSVGVYQTVTTSRIILVGGYPVMVNFLLQEIEDVVIFEAFIAVGKQEFPFLPSTSVPLNSSICMCNSLIDLADVINKGAGSPGIESNCVANTACDGVRCELDIYGVELFVEVIVLPCAHPPSVEMFIEDKMQQPLAEVIFNQSGPVTFFVLGNQLDVDVILENDGRVMRVAATLTAPIMLNLFPLHSIILDRSTCSAFVEEQCTSIQLSAVRNPECDPLGNCTGMSCGVRDLIVNGRAAFTVQKCQDPVSVQVSFVPDDGSSEVYQRVTASQTISVLGYSVVVSILRQDRADVVSFEAIILLDDVVLPFLPSTSVPLNSSACMCDSLRGLASTINTQEGASFIPIENDCAANSRCDGISCQLNILSEPFYSEFILLPCENAVDVVIKDRDRKSLASFITNTSATYKVDINDLTVNIDVTIIQHDYSVEVEIALNFGPIQATIVPRYLLQLDKSKCPPSLPDLATPTCAALYEIAVRADPPLVCDLIQSCVSVSCFLTLDNQYNLLIEPLSCGEKPFLYLAVSAVGSGEHYLDNRISDSSGSTFRVDLPNENVNTSLLFDVKVSDTESRLSIDLISRNTSNLISSTIIPFEKSCKGLIKGPGKTRAITIATIVGVALITVIVIVVIVISWLCYRHRKKTEDFDFQTFRDLEGKEEASKSEEEGAGVAVATNIYESATPEVSQEDGKQEVSLSVPTDSGSETLL